MALLLAAAAQQSTPSAAINKFHSDVLHLDFTYDAALKPAAEAAASGMEQAKNKATGPASKAIDCLSLPLSAADTTDGIRMTVILRMDGACLATINLAPNLADIATSTLNGSLQRFGKPVMGTATEYTMSGKTADAIFGTVKSEKYGLTFYGTVTCAMQGADAACWELMTNDCAKLPAMMAYRVSFDAKPAEPLIPAKLAPPCK